MKHLTRGGQLLSLAAKARWAWLPTRIRAYTHAIFIAFLLLALLVPTWRSGPFTWWPIWPVPARDGHTAALGALALLPGLIATGWLLHRIVERPRRPWRWGRVDIMLPLLGLTLLGLSSLEPALTWRTVAQGIGLGLTWLIYLFLVNERPAIVTPLALVVLTQGAVAVGQFLNQRDLGLRALGELDLDPRLPGTSILWARGTAWLRAYGLTGHPNNLGATLAILILWFLPHLEETRGWRRAGLIVSLSVGCLGLLASFSRASWVAFLVGLALWLRHASRRNGSPWALLLVFGGMLWLYRDLAAARFLSLNIPIEARSVYERLRDGYLALRLVADHPWRGVGLGNYLTVARSLQPDAFVVHNVPLLVAAELGLPGAAMWLWLTLIPLVRRLNVPFAWMAPWLAMHLIGLFDITLWPTTTVRSAIVFAIVIATYAGRLLPGECHADRL
ncbi:MAG: O-antigen ligase family protein [Anaerolineae bacterium]|nr:O-antigen ligase family protein [Anaerolineae bacterium]MDW8099026.1 O-antigen ligase family protein [Anaerolineae bacterium]